MNQLTRLQNPMEPPPAPGRRRRQARSGSFGVLDIGSSKIVCTIARIEGDGEPRVLGFGWQRSRGVKAGSITDLEEAERAIRAAVGQAEEMADTQLAGAIVNLSCGQPESRIQPVQWTIGGRAVTEADIRATLNEARRHNISPDNPEMREMVHAFPLGFSVDATVGVDDPRGMICDSVGARVNIVDAASAALRNLAAGLGRCDMEVQELISAPYAAGLATLVEDEKQLGCTVIDMGGGTTSLAVFQEGHLVHAAQVPLGGIRVTADLAQCLSAPMADAEQLKVKYGSVHEAPQDEKEWLHVPQMGEDADQIARVPRAMVVRIVRPRLEEIFEEVRAKLEAAGVTQEMGRRVVLCGGASQLVGVRELAAQVLDRQVRLARPHQVRGLPEIASGPAFAVTCGLLAWANGEGRPLFNLDPGGERPPGMFRRLVHWFRERVS
jgi:cell division protein FtsA